MKEGKQSIVRNCSFILFFLPFRFSIPWSLSNFHEDIHSIHLAVGYSRSWCYHVCLLDLLILFLSIVCHFVPIQLNKHSCLFLAYLLCLFGIQSRNICKIYCNIYDKKLKLKWSGHEESGLIVQLIVLLSCSLKDAQKQICKFSLLLALIWCQPETQPKI